MLLYLSIALSPRAWLSVEVTMWLQTAAQNIIETAAQDPVQQAELQACREKPVLLVTGVAKLQVGSCAR